MDSAPDWAMQPAITRVGTDLVVFWNHVLTTNTNYHFQYRIISAETLGATVVVDAVANFKGYPASVDVLPDTVPAVPCFYGDTPNANVGGFLALVSAPTPDSAPPPPPDAGTPPADAGTPPPDAGTPPPDAGSPPPSGTLFSDTFARTVAADLGPAWHIDSGSWFVDDRADSARTTADQASVLGLSCADCSVQAALVNFKAATAALDLRQQVNGDRYDAALLSTGHLQIRRHNGVTTTVLGDVASGIVDLTNFSTITLTATGSAPVQLSVAVNATTRLTVSDASASAIAAPGTAGIATNVAGVFFKNFVVTGIGGTGPAPDAGIPAPDAGPPAPDAGAPDPDAGAPPPDAGAPDPDAGAPPPDAGAPPSPPDAGTPPTTGTLFSDTFARTVPAGLGPAWQIDSGSWFVDNRADSARTTADQASVVGLSCADCTVQVALVNFKDANAILDLRQQATGDRYDLLLLPTGHLQIRRHNGATTTVLGDVASGIADLTSFSTLSLAASGSAPVHLVAAVAGTAKLSVDDASASAIIAAGTAGIATNVAGVFFKDFVVTGTGSSATPPPPDAGTPPADAGTPPPDAGTPPPDAGTPPPDAGSPPADAGPAPTGVIFSDNFARTLAVGLGPSWTTVSGNWRTDNRANSDRTTLDRAVVSGVTCGDCRIDARMVNFAGGEAMLELRGSATAHYALALMPNGNLQLRRYAGTTATVLGTAPSGIANLGDYSDFSFSVQGT
ncbi:MAG TPA: hypothetical protein VGF84_07125, partial [Micromonosporaceae bacterium]